MKKRRCRCLIHPHGEHTGFDLVIIDTEMPGAFGRRLAYALKHNVPTIPSLMVSNFSDKAFFIDLVSHGHREFIENVCGNNEATMRIWDVNGKSKARGHYMKTDSRMDNVPCIDGMIITLLSLLETTLVRTVVVGIFSAAL